MKRSTLLHLRIPFSYFLLPVFLFSVAVAPSFEADRLLLVFFILHFLVYPASNGYNSYFDKDEQSIGGLKNPPKVSKELYVTTLIMDLIALILAFLLRWEFAVLIFIYGGVSKAYSHPWVRLKKYPFMGWYIAGFFQGYFTFILCLIGLSDLSIIEVFSIKYQFPAVLCTMLLFGSYPMTQVYQHDEDEKRGDMTISRYLGILGTFYFTAALFTIAAGGFVTYFILFDSVTISVIFVAILSPVLVFFFYWFFKVKKDRNQANYENTMRLNFISSTVFNVFFLGYWLF